MTSSSVKANTDPVASLGASALPNSLDSSEGAASALDFAPTISGVSVKT
jgi:hypothetical protein